MNKIIFTLLIIFALTLMSDFCLAAEGDPLAMAPEKKLMVDGSCANSNAGCSVSQEPERGWFWYKDPVEEKKEPVKEMVDDFPEMILPNIYDIPEDPDKEMKILQTRLETLNNLAVLHPTYDNVLKYKQLEYALTQRATRYADISQRLAWKTPSLNSSLARPNNPQGLSIWNQEKLANKQVFLQEVSKQYGLYYFFSHDCPYCEKFVPLLKQFSRTYGFDILPISLTGEGVPHFPSPMYNPGLVAKFNIEVVPAVFLIQPETEEIYPISYGIISVQELEDRIIRVLGMEEGKMTFDVYDKPTLNRTTN